MRLSKFMHKPKIVSLVVSSAFILLVAGYVVFAQTVSSDNPEITFSWMIVFLLTILGMMGLANAWTRLKEH